MYFKEREFEEAVISHKVHRFSQIAMLIRVFEGMRESNFTVRGIRTEINSPKRVSKQKESEE